MTNSTSAPPLHVHNLESLCVELVSGRSVPIDDEGNSFELPSPETRLVFDWYRKNTQKWAKNVAKADLETLADQLEKTPPELPSIAVATEDQNRPYIHLKSVLVHRFAGIHWYGSPEQAPENFEFEIEKPLTLIEGMNGAGKTSLLSAICWCLTGHVYRAQRPPETIEGAVPLSRIHEETNGTEDTHFYDMSAITPLPSNSVLESLDAGVPVPIDSWVELTFVDDAGNEVGKIRRSVGRSPHGKIQITEPDFSILGLDPIARDVGTKMPGLIPYIQLGTVSCNRVKPENRKIWFIALQEFTGMDLRNRLQRILNSK